MDEEKEDDILPGLEDLEETTLPGLDDKLPESEEIEENDNILPGLEESNEKRKFIVRIRRRTAKYTTRI